MSDVTKEGPPADHEAEVRRQVERLDSYHLAEVSSSILIVAIDQATAASSSDSLGARRTAVLVAAIRASRATRAGIRVISSGYAVEGDVYIRLILELFVSARAALETQEDEEALAWLQGERARGIGRRTRNAMGQPSDYGLLSQAAHGDPRAIYRALMEEAEGQPVMTWGPGITRRTKEALLHLALAARDFTVLLEQAGFEVPEEVVMIDGALERAIPGWRLDAPIGRSGER